MCKHQPFLRTPFSVFCPSSHVPHRTFSPLLRETARISGPKTSRVVSGHVYLFGSPCPCVALREPPPPYVLPLKYPFSYFTHPRPGPRQRPRTPDTPRKCRTGPPLSSSESEPYDTRRKESFPPFRLSKGLRRRITRNRVFVGVDSPSKTLLCKTISPGPF